MSDILEKIIAVKQHEVAAAHKRKSEVYVELVEHSEAGYDLSPVYYSNKVQRTLFLTKDDLPETETTGASK